MSEQRFERELAAWGRQAPRTPAGLASRRVVQGWVEPSLAALEADTRLQFERHGYFVADRVDHAAGRPVFNRVTTLKDSRSK